MRIPDFTDKEFDDAKKLREELTKILKDVGKKIDVTEVIPSNIVMYWIDDGVTPIPTQYKIADGSNGTFDVNSQTLIPVQRI